MKTTRKTNLDLPKALVQKRIASAMMGRMPQFVPVEELFSGRHFDQEIIVLCVRWYLNFKLSYRDLAAMMGERGIGLAHTTILRWVQLSFAKNASAGIALRCRAFVTVMQAAKVRNLDDRSDTRDLPNMPTLLVES